MLDLTTTLSRHASCARRWWLSASPLSHEIDNIRHLEDAGASAVVLYSLFEEQLRRESQELDFYLTRRHGESSREPDLLSASQASSRSGPDGYLEHIRKAKNAVDDSHHRQPERQLSWRMDPVRHADRSSRGGRPRVQHLLDRHRSRHHFGRQVEQQYLDILQAVKSAVHIPVAVKLSPFFSNMANMAKRLEAAGADGLVLFNRFYQPDIDLAALDLKPNVLLSTPQAMRLPLTWIGILHGRVKASLAATGGIHNPRRRNQTAHGRRQCDHALLRPCCATASTTCAPSSRVSGSGWRSTSTSRSSRCKAA